MTTNLPTRISIQEDPQGLLCRKNSYPEWHAFLNLENYPEKIQSHKLFKEGVLSCLKIEEDFRDNCRQIDIHIFYGLESPES